MPQKLPMPFGNPSTYAGHSGVDFAQPRGKAIKALGRGKVVSIHYTELGGWWTTVAYDVGCTLGNGHQDRKPTIVSVGQIVNEGQDIGFVGSLGTRSTGPHLHETNKYNQTYAGTMAWLDPNRVVGQSAPTGGGTVSSNWPARELYGEAWVREAQRKLALLGLYSGDNDGKDGPGTQAATKVLQLAGGLKDDGVYGPKTNALADLILAGHNNIESRPVSDIQRVIGVVADNIWGGKTSFGCYVWQRKNGLTADAIWGPASDAKAFPKTTEPAPSKPVLPARVAREITYPEANRAWTPPYAYRIKDGQPNVRSQKITGIAIHHTGNVVDQESFFTSQNDRISCPNLYINARAEEIELVPYHLKPTSTGAADEYCIAIEVQDVTDAPTWGISDAQHEVIAQFVAWVSRQTSLGGVQVAVPLDRQHVKGHREFAESTNGTICPGPSMRLDWIVERAKQIVNPPAPEPEPDMVTVPRTELEKLRDDLAGMGSEVATAFGELAAKPAGWLS
ncbi:MAG TPA: peptidoglycan DD-metalloendopeptidase family protein [Microbacterium sp.]|nr:peptidoglycan DD-metalloendopeptidase family protein [Microbacterium sp.]